MWASIKEKKKITSAGLRLTVSKILGYELAVVLAYVFQNAYLGSEPSVDLVRITGGIISAVELKSNLENVYRVTGLDLWKRLMGLIQGSKESLLDSVDASVTPPDPQATAMPSSNLQSVPTAPLNAKMYVCSEPQCQIPNFTVLQNNKFRCKDCGTVTKV